MRRELDSDGADMAWQWTASSNQPSRRIGGARQPGSIGDPVRPPGADADCTRCVPAIRSGVRAGHLQRAADHTAARFGHAVASDRSGCADRIVKSGGLIRDIHAALSQLPVSPIIHIMSSTRDLGLPTGAGWILIGNRCGPACARSAGPHTRSDGPRADPGLPRAQLRGRDVNLRAAAHPPRFGTTHRRPRRRTATAAHGPISCIRVGGVAQTPALCDDTR